MPVITEENILRRWNSYYGEKIVLKFQYFNKEGINEFIRVNHLKIKDDLLVEKVGKKLTLQKQGSLPGCFKVQRRKISLGAMNEFLLGYYAIQGLASQFASYILDPKPNETILDMSAAPGGKTAHISSLMNNSGVIFAIDKSKKRLSALRSNLSRLGIKNVISIEGDAVEIVPTLGKVDKIILDAPCSGSGSICKNPQKRWVKNENDIFRLSKIQEQLLLVGLESLKINGELVYSTCSIEPEESEFQIIKILEKLGDYLELIKINPINEFKTRIIDHPRIKSQTYNQKWIRLLPSQDYEGFFVCKLKKIDDLPKKKN